MAVTFSARAAGRAKVTVQATFQGNQVLLSPWTGSSPTTTTASGRCSTAVEKAIAAAKEFAGDRLVDVAAGQIGGQALRLGLIDQMVVNQVPALSAGGSRMTDHARPTRHRG